MKLCILQPAYLPWLGFFERIARCDLCVLLDHVEIDHSSKTRFANRNRVRTAQGVRWLTVPIRSRDERGELALRDVQVLEEGAWRRKHRATIEQSYREAAHFAEQRSFLDELYREPWSTLGPLAEFTVRHLAAALAIQTPFVRSSELGARSRKGELIVDLCRELGASSYLSGPFGRDYLDARAFEAAGIALEFHDYAHPTYAQGRADFEPCLSALDLVLHHGPAAARILRAPPEALAA